MRGGYFLVPVRRLLTAGASLVAERGLWSAVSVVVALWLSYSLSCGIFLPQGWNLHLLHWQVDSYPLGHLGSPRDFILKKEGRGRKQPKEVFRKEVRALMASKAVS